jgi:type II secretory pathway pseudopilin PulG
MTSKPLCARRNQQAFSLVEVVVAIGVVVFAGFALIGLLTVALQTSSNARQQQQAASIIEAICSTRRAAPTADFTLSSSPQPNFPLPALTTSVNNFTASTNTWLTADGALTSSASAARFGFIYNIVAPANYVPGSSPGAATVYMCLFWPAQASPTNATVGHYEVTTTFALP